MTKDQYIAWIESRSSKAADWDMGDCLAADRLIKRTTLDNLRAKIDKIDMPESMKDYLLVAVSLHFGSVETNDMMIELGCYPEWMEPSK